jgi:hypothetical protein
MAFVPIVLAPRPRSGRERALSLATAADMVAAPRCLLCSTLIPLPLPLALRAWRLGLPGVMNEARQATASARRGCWCCSTQRRRSTWSASCLSTWCVGGGWGGGARCTHGLLSDQTPPTDVLLSRCHPAVSKPWPPCHHHRPCTQVLVWSSRWLTLFEKHHTRSQEARSLAQKLFLSQVH